MGGKEEWVKGWEGKEDTSIGAYGRRNGRKYKREGVRGGKRRLLGSKRDKRVKSVGHD